MKHLHLLLTLGVLMFLLVRDAGNASACGGSYTFFSEVVGPPSLRQGLGESPPEEEWFLYPYRLVHPHESELLWKFSYEGLDAAPPLDPGPFERALARSDAQRARREARALIERWYGLPPVLAALQRPLLLRAVGYLEGGVPVGSAAASPSQRFLDLMTTFRHDVPDGWYRGGQNTAAAPVVAEQLRALAAWHQDHPQHPLRDLASFWQVRAHYFAGDFEAAWSLLFQLYGRRRVRALAEMRYFVQQGLQPSDQQLDSLTDPLLISLFVGRDTTTPLRFERWWRLAERARASRSGVVLQERLLRALVEQPVQAALPTAFPKRPEQRSQAWGILRGLALLKYGRPAQACAQLEMLHAEPQQAVLLANCRLALGKPLEAARTRALNHNELHYLLQVILPRAEVQKLRADPDPAIRAEALLAAAVERVGARDYGAAAQLIKASYPEGAAALERIALLQRPGSELELARALRARRRSLLWEVEPGLYRGLGAGLAPNGPEARNLAAYWEAAFGSFQALQPFVEWLEQHPTAPLAPSVLKEADGAYNELLAFGSHPDLFWAKHLPRHQLARRLREVGRRIGKVP